MCQLKLKWDRDTKTVSIETGCRLPLISGKAKIGINGKQIKLVKGDDACEPKQAVAVANRFVDQDKVQAVIGHFYSSSTIPASEIYNDAGILEMTPSSTNPAVTDRGFGNLHPSSSSASSRC